MPDVLTSGSWTLRVVTDTMMSMRPKVYTSGDVARILNEKTARVRHILATRDHIQPVGMAGLIRLYSHETIEAVAAELLRAPTTSASLQEVPA